VGFRPITLTQAGKHSSLAAIGDLPVLHWHGDTFDLPDGVELLASSGLYKNQAFSRGTNILALQFHPEMGEDASFETWCEKGDPFIAIAGTDLETLSAEHTRHGPAAVAAGRVVLDSWLAGLDA
jgi:GMP synthase (glutamine-hydrolysing)